MRDKLIELIVAGRGCPYNADKYSDGRKLCQRCKYNIDSPCWAGVIADHLIANGVTFAGDNNFGKWIPVSERLPTSNDTAKGRVWAILKGERPDVWSYISVQMHPEEFVCWMPLPELPEPQKEDEA